jgi:hypothetical protein
VKIARDWIATHPLDSQVLIIAHSAEAATDLHLNIVNSTGSWFGIKRFTLNLLASRMAQHALAAHGTAPVSTLSFVAIVARAVHSLHSNGQNCRRAAHE